MRGKDGMAYEIQVQRMHRMAKCSQAIMHISFRYTAQPYRVLISDANPGLAAGDLLRGNQRPAGGARSPQSTTISHTVHAIFLRLHGTSCGLSLVGKGACNAAESWPVFSGEWDI